MWRGVELGGVVVVVGGGRRRMTGCWSHFCWGASVGVRFVAESEKTGRGMGGVFSKKNIEVKEFAGV
mgnify:CR=1 FL=1